MIFKYLPFLLVAGVLTLAACGQHGSSSQVQDDPSLPVPPPLDGSAAPAASTAAPGGDPTGQSTAVSQPAVAQPAVAQPVTQPVAAQPVTQSVGAPVMAAPVMAQPTPVPQPAAPVAAQAAVQPASTTSLVLKFLAYVAGPQQCTQLAQLEGFATPNAVSKWVLKPGSSTYVIGCFVWSSSY